MLVSSEFIKLSINKLLISVSASLLNKSASHKITIGIGTGLLPALILLVSSGSRTEAIVLQQLFLFTAFLPLVTWT